jgi:hypothetical protein
MLYYFFYTSISASTDLDDRDAHTLTIIPTLQVKVNRYVTWQISLLFLWYELGIANQRLPCFDDDHDHEDDHQEEFLHVD